MSEQPLSLGHPWALGSPPSAASPTRIKSLQGSKRLLRRLAIGSGWLEPLQGLRAARGDFRFAAAGQGQNQAQPTVERRIVQDWQSRGWIAATPSGMLKLTAAGHQAAGVDRPGHPDDVSPHRRQHGLITEETRTIDAVPQKVTVNATESPLGWLVRRHDRHGRPLIDEAQYTAGERLRADFTIAGLSPRVTASWEQTIASGSSGRSGGATEALMMSERAMDARRRVNRALSVVGPELAGILLEVCCLAGGLEVAERRLGLPQRSGKVVLQIALARLSEHYGLVRQGRCETEPVRIRSWGSETYRPVLFGPAPE